MTEESTIAKGSLWALSSSVVTKFISFLYTVIIARIVLAEQIGIFYLALSVLGILFIFTDFGIMYALTRYVPYLYGREEFGRLRKLIRLSYMGGGTLTLIFSLLIFVLSEFISQFIGQPAIAPILQIMSVWLLLKEIDDINRGVLIGRKMMKEARCLEIVQNFIKLVLTLIAFYIIGFNAEALSVGFLLSFLLMLPIGTYYVIQETKGWKKEKITITLSGQLKLGKEVVTFGLIVTLINVLGVVLQYTDRIMLGYLIEGAFEKIAIYSIALGLANLVLIFPTAITGIFFPVVSELFGKEDFNAINKTLKLSMKWLIFLMVPFALILGVFGTDLLELFYGDVYKKGAVVLALFVVGLFIRSIFYIPQFTLSAMRRLDVELKAVGAAAIANIVLNYLFIPPWGIDGAALASLISFMLLSVMLFYYSKKTFGFSFPREAYKPLIAGAVALGIILLMKGPILVLFNEYVSAIQIGASGGQMADEIAQNLVKLVMFGLLFLFSVLVYFLALLFLKAFGEEEITLLEAGLRKARIPEKYVSWSRSILEAKWLKIPFLR